MITLGLIEWQRLTLRVDCGTYGLERVALKLVIVGNPRHKPGAWHDVDDGGMPGETWATLSVHVEGEPIGWGEFVVNHDLTEDPAFVRHLLEPRDGVALFEDTTRRCSFGWVVGCPILRLAPPVLASLDAAIGAMGGDRSAGERAAGPFPDLTGLELEIVELEGPTPEQLSGRRI